MVRWCIHVWLSSARGLGTVLVNLNCWIVCKLDSCWKSQSQHANRHCCKYSSLYDKTIKHRAIRTTHGLKLERGFPRPHPQPTRLPQVPMCSSPGHWLCRHVCRVDILTTAGRSVHDIHRCVRVLIALVTDIKLIDRIRSFVLVIMTTQINIHFVLMKQPLEVFPVECAFTKTSLQVLYKITAIKGPVSNGNNPWDIVAVLRRPGQILLKPFVLIGSVWRVLLSREHCEVYSHVVEGIVQGRRWTTQSVRHAEAIDVRIKVKRSLVVSRRCHVGNGRRNRLDHFGILVPDERCVSNRFIVVGVRNVSSVHHELNLPRLGGTYQTFDGVFRLFHPHIGHCSDPRSILIRLNKLRLQGEMKLWRHRCAWATTVVISLSRNEVCQNDFVQASSKAGRIVRVGNSAGVALSSRLFPRHQTEEANSRVGRAQSSWGQPDDFDRALSVEDKMKTSGSDAWLGVSPSRTVSLWESAKK